MIYASKQRILAVSLAFIEAQQDNPDQDALSVLEQLLADPGCDEEIVMTLRALQLDGTLASAVIEADA